MRRIPLVLLILAGLFALYGFGFQRQAAANPVSVLNRSGAETTRITDGDTVRLQITLLQPVTSQQSISFKLSDQDLLLGSCAISTGSTCQTDPISSLGWHWDANGSPQATRLIQAYDAAGELIGQSMAVTILPRPVILVHGFVSTWDAWVNYLGPQGYLASIGLQGFAVGDGQFPGVLNTGDFNDPTVRTNTLAQNAAIEGQYIAAVKQATGAEMVDLVVHSMGGMISRYYLDRVMGDRDVAQLIMLGSPMGGSDCTVLPAALGFYLPASLEIRQSYMSGVFNRQITHRHGVEFYDLGGTAIQDAFKSPCTDVPNDTAVSLSSINAIPLQSSTFDDIHSDLKLSSQVFTDFVKPLLEKPAGSFTLSADPEPAAGQTPLQFTRVYTGHVQAGGSSDLTINIEAGVSVASFALYDSTRSVTVSVRGASGNVIQLDPGQNGLIQISDPSSFFYLGYGFSNPTPGQWKITLLATDSTPAQGADFAISVYFIGGPTLEAQSSTLIPGLGEAVQFTASLSLNGQLLEIQQAQALVRAPNGETETLKFEPGTLVSTQWTPRELGTYGVDIVVTGVTADGAQVERTAFLGVEVQPNPTRAQVGLNISLILVMVAAGLGLLVILLILLFSWVFRGARR